MPLKLSIGLSKKIGQPDYCSIGTNCHVEVELDGDLLQRDLDEVQKHVRTWPTVGKAGRMIAMPYKAVASR